MVADADAGALKGICMLQTHVAEPGIGSSAAEILAASTLCSIIVNDIVNIVNGTIRSIQHEEQVPIARAEINEETGREMELTRI
jgi:hypothetical protein